MFSSTLPRISRISYAYSRPCKLLKTSLSCVPNLQHRHLCNWSLSSEGRGTVTRGYVISASPQPAFNQNRTFCDPGVSDVERRGDDGARSDTASALSIHLLKGIKVAGPDDSPNRKLRVVIEGDLVELKAVELYGKIKEMKSDEILSLVEHSHQHLDMTHLALSLRTIYRQSSTPHSRLSTLAHPAFPTLCAGVVARCRHLEPSVLVDMVEFMIYFRQGPGEVPSDNESLTTSLSVLDASLRVILGVLSHTLNDLSVDQLVTLADCLHDMPDTKQTAVVRHAIATLCRSCVDEGVVKGLGDWHRISLLGLVEDKVGEMILVELWKSRREWTDDITYCVMTLRAMSLMESRHDPLALCCLESIREQVDGLSVDEVPMLLEAF